MYRSPRATASGKDPTRALTDGALTNNQHRSPDDDDDEAELSERVHDVQALVVVRVRVQRQKEAYRVQVAKYVSEKTPLSALHSILHYTVPLRCASLHLGVLEDSDETHDELSGKDPL
eukprot:3452660-Pyramimonas_sp.AAC.1